MKREDTEHLAKLARIALTEEEVQAFTLDITSILGYVSEIQDITGNENLTKEVGPLYNVTRDDEQQNEAGAYTEVLLNEAPDRDGQYVKVKKIIGEKS